MDIPTWLRGVVEERGYKTVRQAAQALGFEPTQFWRWCTGNTSPSVPSCYQLSEATGLPVEEIVLMAALGHADEGAPDEAEVGSH